MGVERPMTEHSDAAEARANGHRARPLIPRYIPKGVRRSPRRFIVWGPRNPLDRLVERRWRRCDRLWDAAWEAAYGEGGLSDD